MAEYFLADAASEPPLSPALIDRARELALQGAPLVDIARELGVRLGTLQAWRQRYPLLGRAFDEWRATADDEVERAAYRHALADPVSAHRWLASRRPQQWAERRHVTQEVTGTLQVVTGVPEREELGE